MKAKEVVLILIPFCFCSWSYSPPLGQGFLIYEVSRSHTTTHYSW